MKYPLSFRALKKEQYLSEWIVSVRKDVECMLKNRFRIFKNPIRFHNMEDVQSMMYVCCMIHNMILDWDRNLSSMWEHNILWGKLQPFEEEP
jgi:hypothetical protein